MENVELFALYEVRKGLYLDVKNQISKVQTDIARLNTKIRSSNTEKEVHGKTISAEDLISMKDKKEHLLKELYIEYSYNKRLYDESKKEIECLKALYDDPNIYSKEKNIFYIYYYSQFNRPRKTLDRVSHLLSITYDHVRRLSVELNKTLYEKIAVLKEK